MVWENKTHKTHRDFQIQTDLQILAKRLDLVIIYKTKPYQYVDFAVLVDHRGNLLSFFA